MRSSRRSCEQRPSPLRTDSFLPENRFLTCEHWSPSRRSPLSSSSLTKLTPGHRRSIWLNQTVCRFLSWCRHWLTLQDEGIFFLKEKTKWFFFSWNHQALGDVVDIQLLSLIAANISQCRWRPKLHAGHSMLQKQPLLITLHGSYDMFASCIHMYVHELLKLLTYRFLCFHLQFMFPKSNIFIIHT